MASLIRLNYSNTARRLFTIRTSAIPEIANFSRDGAVFVVHVVRVKVQSAIPFIQQQTKDLEVAYFER
ncbi:hypothetical protein HFO98_19055 [Rhizobium leguminosarum]|uniref:hypothetical protein n=1 Tax=Rhizobium leguminosarum TaxID=384 RepID=UPI001C961E88|nr:hypothetical protein [Rhizobium leguminosarum]MBY5410523.1 hypothetical protein [Rhizobium leguminosarum]